jgi:tol-pal system protein YbgF
MPIPHRHSRLAGALALALMTASPLPVLAQELFPPLEIAQSQEAAQLQNQILQLQEQVRNLTGQVEGLQFQLTQLQTLIERMQQDNESRFSALEGGGSGNGAAAPESNGATPSAEVPQTTTPDTSVPEGGVTPLPGELEFDPTYEGGDQPMDDLGQSGDPLVGTGNGEQAVALGTLPADQLSDGGVASAGPLDLSLNGGGTQLNPDAEAQYAAGYDALVRGDYEFAEEQFRQFVALYPDDRHSADATNWLGETLIQRNQFGEAAEILLDGFQRYEQTPRAPDLLMRLGIALAGAGERDTACLTLQEVPRRYADLSPAFRNRLAEEEAKAQCPPAG